MDTEEWVGIVGYLGIYEVSNKGQIRSLDRNTVMSHGGIRFSRGKMLVGCVHKGRRDVNLHRDGETDTFMVSRLVAQAFLPDWDDTLSVDRIDGTLWNDDLTNLKMGEDRKPWLMLNGDWAPMPISLECPLPQTSF